MLILNGLDNGVGCDCGVSRALIMTDYDISHILQEIFSLKIGCTNSVLHLV